MNCRNAVFTTLILLLTSMRGSAQNSLCEAWPEIMEARANNFDEETGAVLRQEGIGTYFNSTLRLGSLWNEVAIVSSAISDNKVFEGRRSGFGSAEAANAWLDTVAQSLRACISEYAFFFKKNAYGGNRYYITTAALQQQKRTIAELAVVNIKLSSGQYAVCIDVNAEYAGLPTEAVLVSPAGAPEKKK